MGTSNKQYQPTLVIKSCSDCPNIRKEPQYTSDSWERANNWYCTETELENDGKKIAGYVEWMDIKDIKVPEWCPLRIKRKKEKV